MAGNRKRLLSKFIALLTRIYYGTLEAQKKLLLCCGENGQPGFMSQDSVESSSSQKISELWFAEFACCFPRASVTPVLVPRAFSLPRQEKTLGKRIRHFRRSSCSQGARDFRMACFNFAMKLQRSPLALNACRVYIA